MSATWPPSRFLALLASRHGQLLNKTGLAAPLGVSVPMIGDWLHVLEITGRIMLVPPYFENFGKRLIKSPKVYLGDSGLAGYLLGIATQAELDRSPFLGALFEGCVAAEILKSQVNRGRRKELYHFRDRQGLEWISSFRPPTEVCGWRSARRSRPSCRAMRGHAPVRMTVVHRASTTAGPSRGLAPGVDALDVRTR